MSTYKTDLIYFYTYHIILLINHSQKIIEQSHSVALCTENRGLFIKENWNLIVKAVPKNTRYFFAFSSCLFLLIVFVVCGVLQIIQS